MKYYVSSNIAELQTLEAKIHQYMIDNIKDYSAEKWSEIYKHPTNAEYVLPIKDSDPRSPIDSLSDTEKTKLVDSLSDDWYVKTDDGKILELASSVIFRRKE